MSELPPPKTFLDWTSNRDVSSLGTNTGAQTLPFQNWRSFKEAFAPELIERAVNESPIPVKRCIDPFGGSGTTGLACQFLGVHPVVAEVNPYLGDLIEAKLYPYDSIDTLTSALESVIASIKTNRSYEPNIGFASAPPTFVEPGHNGRWIFDKEVANCILALRHAFGDLDDAVKRLFRVILGGLLVDVSNVLVSGKGRRYRRRWKERRTSSRRVEELFISRTRSAIEDIRCHSPRRVTTYDVLRGDSRETAFYERDPCELTVFSPPYPNSFDYTDVYNIELWALGYLSSSEENTALRSATLTSHVQVARDFRKAPDGSPTLIKILDKLACRRDELWNRKIPEMVGGYFSDLLDVVGNLRQILSPGALAWIVIGDSRYAGVQIPTSTVLAELVENCGWNVHTTEPCRSIRTSPQQGGQKVLNEQLLVLRTAI